MDENKENKGYIAQLNGIFNICGAMYQSETYFIQNNIYTFANIGAIINKSEWFSQYKIGYEKTVWYWLNGDDTVRNGWLIDNEKWYYLDCNGIIIDGFIFDYYSNNHYYLDYSGVIQVGWINLNGAWHCLYN